jgi:hypothetical protein
MAKLADLSLTDLVDRTYVWTYLEEESPCTLVQLYREIIKIFSNRTHSLEGGLVLMEDKLKEQLAGLEWAPPSPISLCLPTKTTVWRWPQATSLRC